MMPNSLSIITKYLSRLVVFGCVCFIFFPTTLMAQSDLRTTLMQYQLPLSVFDENDNRFSFRLQAQAHSLFRENPATSVWMHQRIKPIHQDSILNSFGQSLILSKASAAKRDGDYLIHEGNAFTDIQLLSGGELYRKNLGSIFGMGQYARGAQKGFAWNSTRHADLYLPYIFSDSSGGDYTFENYFLKGGYSFMLYENLSLGFLGSYRGEHAHKLTDPRALNISSWLNLRVGLGFKLNEYLMSLHAGFLYQKQYISLRNWRPGQQDKFFITYGFGLIDETNTFIGFGGARMHYLNGWELSVGIQPLENKKQLFTVYAGIDAHGEFLSVEESSVKNLFSTRTNTIKPWIVCEIPLSEKSSLDIQYSGRYSFRQGLENIYEKYKVEDSTGYYDDRIVDVRKRYHLMHLDNNLKVKFNYKITHKYVFHVLSGIMNTYRKEMYKTPDFLMKNLSIMPMVGLGMTLNNRRDEGGIEGIFHTQTPLERVYQVEPEMEMTDFQHAFLPFAFYSRQGYTFRASLYYAHNFSNKYKIGLNMQGGISNGSRPDDIRYNKKPSYQSGFASIPKGSDEAVHNVDKWANISLFIIF